MILSKSRILYRLIGSYNYSYHILKPTYLFQRSLSVMSEGNEGHSKVGNSESQGCDTVMTPDEKIDTSQQSESKIDVDNQNSEKTKCNAPSDDGVLKIGQWSKKQDEGMKKRKEADNASKHKDNEDRRKQSRVQDKPWGGNRGGQNKGAQGGGQQFKHQGSHDKGSTREGHNDRRNDGWSRKDRTFKNFVYAQHDEGYNTGNVRKSDKKHGNNWKSSKPKEHKDFVFFWRKDSIYSQWHERGFEVGGKKFSCAEQWMMFSKADLFNDTEIAKEILWTNDPREHKRLGRMVRGFNQRIWDDTCMDIVKLGNYEKFTQNGELKEQILSTHPKILVEASPMDRIWGIGLEASDPKAWDKKTWRGRNLLGYALTEVRKVIMEEETGETNRGKESEKWHSKINSAKLQNEHQGKRANLEKTEEKVSYDNSDNNERKATNEKTSRNSNSVLDNEAENEDLSDFSHENPHDKNISKTDDRKSLPDMSTHEAIADKTERMDINSASNDTTVQKPTDNVVTQNQSDIESGSGPKQEEMEIKTEIHDDQEMVDTNEGHIVEKDCDSKITNDDQSVENLNEPSSLSDIHEDQSIEKSDERSDLGDANEGPKIEDRNEDKNEMDTTED